MNTDVDIKWSINFIYECENTKQFVKYYHSSLGNHPKRMLAAAIKQGHIKGAKGLLKEYATKAEHMRTMPKGVRSTTTQMNRRRPKQTPLDLEREQTADETAATPIQAHGNKKPI